MGRRRGADGEEERCRWGGEVKCRWGGGEVQMGRRGADGEEVRCRWGGGEVQMGRRRGADGEEAVCPDIPQLLEAVYPP